MTCTQCDGSGKIPNYGTCPQCSHTHKYAGIGARVTPEAIVAQMQSIAMRLAMSGWFLRSGGAKGADKAFEAGCDVINPSAKSIRCGTLWEPAMNHAARYHPAWSKCSNDAARSLHARNSLVMMGDHLNDPVKFVVCWTVDGAVTGGTGQALRIAQEHQIPIFNLAVTDEAALWEFLT